MPEAAGSSPDGVPGLAGEPTGVVPIQSVQRAARLLQLFTASDPELTLAEITARLGMSRATAHRYGISLRSTGLLRYRPKLGTYSLGPAVIELGRIALANLSIIKIAGPLLEDLSEELNETLVVSVWDGAAPVVVDVADRTDRLVSVAIRVGSRLPVPISAQALVFLAFSATARGTVIDLPGVTDAEGDVARVRAAGVAVSDGVIAGISVVAAPVLENGDVACTIAIVAHQASGVARPDSPAVARLRETATEISARLGG